MPILLFEKDVLTYTFLVDVDESEPDAAKEKAENVVKAQFDDILKQAKPDGVEVDTEFLGDEEEPRNVATVRQKINDGEQSGQIVTYRLHITAPNQLVPPNSSWLIGEVREEPGNGLILLYSAIARIPSQSKPTRLSG